MSIILLLFVRKQRTHFEYKIVSEMKKKMVHFCEKRNPINIKDDQWSEFLLCFNQRSTVFEQMIFIKKKTTSILG